MLPAQLGGRGVALADDQPVTVQNIFAVRRVFCVNLMCDIRELFLLPGQRHSLKDTVITAAQPNALIGRQMRILGNETDICLYISADSMNDLADFIRLQRGRCLDYHMTLSVPD